jgi:hypothetical protein
VRHLFSPNDSLPANELIEEHDEFNQAIKAVLAEQPLSDIKNIIRPIEISKSTIQRLLI